MNKVGTREAAALWTNTHHGMTLDSDSFQGPELHEYPRAVIRELAVNALSHRSSAG